VLKQVGILPIGTPFSKKRKEKKRRYGKRNDGKENEKAAVFVVS
jgi:hypothetical protein